MRRCLVFAVVVLGWVSASGCAPKGVLTELPEPVFGTVRQAPPEPAPAPRVAGPAPTSLVPNASPGWIPPGGIPDRWTCIVIHHSASEVGGAQAFDRFHRDVRKWDELGYHFVIGNGSDTPDGAIEVGSRWTKQKHGAHCKTPDNYYNDHGIGVCLVGDFSRHPPSPAQMHALARLVRFLMETCGIDAAHVLTHGGVTHRTQCPGARFSLRELKSRLGPSLAAASIAP